jgi:hypothetical protein
MTQQTSLIIICINTVIQVNQIKYYADEDTFFQKWFLVFHKMTTWKSEIKSPWATMVFLRNIIIINILVSISGGNGGGPSLLLLLRGNIINTTNADNYPLGSLSEADTRNYTIQQ